MVSGSSSIAEAGCNMPLGRACSPFHQWVLWLSPTLRILGSLSISQRKETTSSSTCSLFEVPSPPSSLGTVQKMKPSFFYPTLLLARSTGTLRLASSNPHDHPILDPRYLTDEHDLQVGVCAFKKARDIIKTEPLSEWIEREELDPEIPHDPESDEYMEEYIKQHCSTVYHQCGTAKMGPEEDAEAVVDLKLKVRGVDGLRVADASIMPTVITANIQAAVIMIGERAADFILSDFKGTFKGCF